MASWFHTQTNQARSKTLAQVRRLPTIPLVPPSYLWFPGVRGLNLSMSLVPSWQSVAAITSELPLLERLELKRVLI